MNSKQIRRLIGAALALGLPLGLYGICEALHPAPASQDLVQVRVDGTSEPATPGKIERSREARVLALEAEQRRLESELRAVRSREETLRKRLELYRKILPPEKLPELVKFLESDRRSGAGPHRSQVLVAARIAEAWYGVPRHLVESMAWHESRFNAAAVSRSACRGTMQVSSLVWRTYGKDLAPSKVHDPLLGTLVGARYIGALIRSHRGNKLRALAFYNAGGNVSAGMGYARAVLASASTPAW